ncbi:defensin-like protein 39 [Trifolium pratense]|uniref:Uncharacterized protein n=1 Tax=Trifolium pratense TaxID=57577 RepID=A0ACB0KTY5_TRIPR|nr:defensin-like protein 39 [Trifolium pratense]CAJ2659847.1 unnamed protein product [Trifolium pratense]
MEKKSLTALSFLFLVLFVAQQIVVTEAQNKCEHLADTYKGPCFTNASCDDHCKNKEHFRSGTCHGFRCWCTHQNC